MMHGYNIEIGGAYLLHFRKLIEDDAYHNEAMDVLRKTGKGFKRIKDGCKCAVDDSILDGCCIGNIYDNPELIR